MPATTISSSQPCLGHVNLMLDTFLANININDLRAIVRSSLATCPSLTPSFIDAAKRRLEQKHPKTPSPVLEHLFVSLHTGDAMPGPALHDELSAIRSLYGVGMGIAGLQCLTDIVKATVGLRWEADGEMVDVLAVIDADITQAIQSAKEELMGGGSRESAITTATELKAAVKASRLDTEHWGGDFPFEKTADSLDYWHL
ncbi:hypothetical protein QCA50_004549 [Cerrena zonata]|uniref:Uncharacterized protein n=1 Tax=Cerrena zonata TaxID=2478898 RepID=A0AAW0GU19_9APHY